MSPKNFVKKAWRLLDNLLTAPLAVSSPFLALLGMELVRSQADVFDICLAFWASFAIGFLPWAIWLNSEP